MAKLLTLNLDNAEEVCDVGKALSTPVRLDILKLLQEESLNIGEIAEKLGIAASSAALHVKVLEKAKLINAEVQPGTRGAVRLCSRKNDLVTIGINGAPRNVNMVTSVSMPIGAYTDCEMYSTCGIADEVGVIGNEDLTYCFYLPEHLNAQIIWSSAGYVEYKFPNQLPEQADLKRLGVSLEICSEAPNYREDWKSDITMWINHIDCGTWRSPGDFGARRGRITPPSCLSGNTQYGLLTTWEVRKDGCYVNENKVGNITTEMLDIKNGASIVVRIGNKKDAKYVGGFNIFGEKFGDYPQNIVLSIEY
ncbi:putative transcriptional regulator [Kineothrix alysoides]|uniref:Putative transcriptional regulator n=1 Tax=Kineothrix alysoides TaxID=1469948 RepID=A0A4V2QAT7_9FIRM|nr:helix-turn-helix domain-containing protein [Kineothrix alysoides]TCL53812.1 putative transcriptional regulator [Kineothrix alysoides]